MKPGSCFDPALVTTWKATGAYPGFHKALADLVVERARGRRLLDLGCNHGLLGRQLLDRLPGIEDLFGIEADGPTARRANAAGLGFHVVELALDPSNYDELYGLLREFRTNVVVARRCIPEILGPVRWSAPDFTAALAKGGCQDLFVQGRVGSKASSPVPDVDAEIALMTLGGHYRLDHRVGSCAHLVAVSG